MKRPDAKIGSKLKELYYNIVMQMKLGIDQTDFTAVGKIEIPEIFFNRMKSGVQDFDKLFGDGLLPGASMTLTAQAGCGKTTFALQLLEQLSQAGYATG